MEILLRVLFVPGVGLGAIIIINRLCFYKHPPDIDGAVTLCVYSSLFLCVCVLANFLHCNKSPTKAPFSAVSNEAIFTQQFVPQSFSSVTTDILFDWLNVVYQLKETWGQFGIIKGKSKCNFWGKKNIAKGTMAPRVGWLLHKCWSNFIFRTSTKRQLCTKSQPNISNILKMVKFATN